MSNFSGLHLGLTGIRANQTRLEGGVEDVNELLGTIERLNRELASASPPPNDLLDKRDRSFDELSTLIGTEPRTVSEAEDTEHAGMVDMLDDGEAVVATSAAPVHEVVITAGGELELDDATALDPSGGELAALQGFTTRDDGLPGWRDRLEGFATALADALNDGHSRGVDAQGTAGGALVSLDAPDPAGTIAVAFDDPELVAAGKPDGGALDGRNAAEMAALRDGDLPEARRSVTVELGRLTANATREADARESLHSAAERARSSAHGVSVDEESVSLVEHQRALEASSRVMTTIDEALDVPINLTGLVGR